jgi:hypothetical protein
MNAPPPTPRSTSPALVALAWVAVAAPLLWGIFQTLKKAAALFA